MKKIHFIGIGGIGLSALALFLREQAYEISGSDLAPSQLTAQLAAQGIKISTPHAAENVHGAELIIYSAAVKPANVEFTEARRLGIPTLSRKAALPMILSGKRVLAVAGAHGKSTTASILATLLPEASLIIGAIMKAHGSNMLCKPSELLVFEADESDSSFLNANPHLAIVTNTEAEHLEHYGHELARLQGAYADFLAAAKLRVINAGDEFLAHYPGEATRLDPALELGEVRMRVENFIPLTSFRLRHAGQDLGEFTLQGMGEHVALDAALALLGALSFLSGPAKFDPELVELLRGRLRTYAGIKKRFDLLHADERVGIIDDYAHHPTEVRATLAAAREYARLAGYDRLVVIFQPHRYSRLAANLADFAEALADADELIILPVYAAGEEPVALDLAAAFAGAVFAEDVRREGLALRLACGRLLDRGLIIGFSAGDLSDKLRG